jgi:hypothetical protein
MAEKYHQHIGARDIINSFILPNAPNISSSSFWRQSKNCFVSAKGGSSLRLLRHFAPRNDKNKRIKRWFLARWWGERLGF